MFGNRNISSGLCEVRSQAEPGVRRGGRLDEVLSCQSFHSNTKDTYT